MEPQTKTHATTEELTEFITHPLIKPDTVEKRMYQLNLTAAALKGSTLAVLPTGLGKTIIALLVIAQRLNGKEGKVLILSPTKPLVEQHASFLKKVMTLPQDDIIVFTGSIPPSKRAELWEKSRIIVSTPQVIENDLLSRRIDLKDVVHITFDEAHRAVGRYAYVHIAEKYQFQAREPLVLGITASPGSTNEKIDEVCHNLSISNIQVRTDTDPDVRPYIHFRDLEWRKITVPVEIQELKVSMERVFNNRLEQLIKLGFVDSHQKYLNKLELLDLQSRLQGKLRNGPDQRVYTAVSLVAEVFKVGHAMEIAETQGPDALAKYFERLEHEANSKSGSKASRRLMDDVNMRQVMHALKDMDVVHPKLEAVKEIVSDQLTENPDSRVIVFTNYRDTSELVTNCLEEIENVRPVRFVGQASKYKDTGLTQKQQVDILDKFKSGIYNTLVATSVAEEGLDIPATDLVVFFEPVPSEIRSIQRKGRTGRAHAGKVIVLIAKGTKDEAYYWSSQRKEKNMNDSMRQFSKPGSSVKKPDIIDSTDTYYTDIPDAIITPDVIDAESIAVKQKQISEFTKEFPDKLSKEVPESPDKVLQIYVDHREIRSGVARALEAAGVQVIMKTLEVGDYVVSDKVAIERKTDMDFLDSIIDKNRNIFSQISDLAKAYDRPVLLIEGENLYTGRQIHPNAIRGVLVSIATDFGVPIINTRDEEDTAAFLHVMVKREQEENNRSISLHGRKTAQTLKEQQEYIISSISNIGPAAARKLLRHFGSVETIMKADIEQLLEVDSIGPKTAQRIREVVGSQYKG
ncbi:MAG TPA: DEAD/DEAH box helicase [Candidatus Nanoarchaeia archaeon]|nr:DEAD/DEAH box helicase [Candidatus Nanoarchaeia archaeon]